MCRPKQALNQQATKPQVTTPDRLGKNDLAHAGRADQDDVGGLADEPQRGQFPDQGLISAGLAEKS